MITSENQARSASGPTETADVLSLHQNRFLRRIRLDGVGRFDPLEGNLNTRDRLLLESVKLFAKFGYEGCSMKDLAKSVDIGAPAIYNHFPSKGVLLIACIDFVLSTFYEAVLANLNHESPYDCLMEIVGRHSSFTVRHRPFARASDSILNTDFIRRVVPAPEALRFIAAMREYRVILRELIDDIVGPDQRVESALRAFIVHQISDRSGEWYEPEDEGAPALDSIVPQCIELTKRVIGMQGTN